MSEHGHKSDGAYFSIDPKIMNELMKKKEEEEEIKRRATERVMKVKEQREALRSSTGGVPHISDMKIVLLGCRDGGKSSCANTILGTPDFHNPRRTECVKREGETQGRHIAVVETPGWWNNYTVDQTPYDVKQEIVSSVSLCSPGPHALLLVIRVDTSFIDTYRRAVQEHLELLGEKVWSHTIVLFTNADCLGDTSIDEHIESGGDALQWLVDKCGNRYHVLGFEESDGSQVTELLDRIEEMVKVNSGHHFSIDENMLITLTEKKMKKREVKRRAEQRKINVQKQRESLKSSGGVPHISDMRIVLLGYRNAGKSSCGNTILGTQEFQTARRTAECEKREGENAGRHITVVEAPGWLAYHTAELTPDRDKREIVLSMSLCPPGPHALLLVIRVNESFTEIERRAVQEHLELLGEGVWSHTIVLFTVGEWLKETSIEQHIESGVEALQWLVEKCGNRYHVLDNRKFDDGQVTELLEKIEEIAVLNSGDRSIGQFPDFSEANPDDLSRRDSAYASISAVQTDMIEPLKKLTIAAAAEQQTSPSMEKLTPDFKADDPFVDSSTIVYNSNESIGQGSYGIVHRGSWHSCCSEDNKNRTPPRGGKRIPYTLHQTFNRSTKKMVVGCD
ncbi:GTPase IMAP family member 8-like [Engraulis encrasicolus]|uniref:GTPase IMAP family member 8-like n=1 Tax=Engraulis encrasicolus TaxID=184585 RepID=UPI002FD79394